MRRLAWLFLLILPLSERSLAQDYPSKPVRVIIPYQAGSSTDVIGRQFTELLSKTFGQSFYVENRLGASGSIGAAAAAKAAPDGYTLLVGTAASHAMNPFLYQSVGYDPEKDFEFIALAGNVPMVISANPSLNIRSVQELIARSRTTPLNVAVPSTVAQIVLQLFKQRTDAPLTAIPYKGSATAMTETIGGQVQVIVDAASPTRPQASAGKIIPLGITTAATSELMPGLKSVAEQGLPGFEIVGWQGFFAPKGVPANIVARLNAEIDRILADQNMRSKMIDMGLEPGKAGSPDQLAGFMKNEIAKWGNLIKSANIKVQ